MLIQILQIAVGLGLLNVWLVRANLSTAYRGGNAQNIREEFAVYGLPAWFCTLIGVLKVGAAIALLAALWFPEIRQPAAALIAALMVGAVSMHAKVRDPIIKTVPAAAMLLMSLVICLY
jgi:hypothetical protein